MILKLSQKQVLHRVVPIDFVNNFLKIKFFFMRLSEFYPHYLAILLALLQPIIILSYLGPVYSISTVWHSDLQPLFIISNAITSFLFFCTRRWTIPSLLLLILTAFSVDMYPQFHTGVALLFFLSCYYPLLAIKRLRFYSFIYLITGPIGYLYGLFWLEVWGIFVLCIYHVHYIWYLEKIKNPNYS